MPLIRRNPRRRLADNKRPIALRWSVEIGRPFLLRREWLGHFEHEMWRPLGPNSFSALKATSHNICYVFYWVTRATTSGCDRLFTAPRNPYGEWSARWQRPRGCGLPGYVRHCPASNGRQSETR